MANAPCWQLSEQALPRVLWANLGFHRPGISISEHRLEHHVLDVVLAGTGSWTRNGHPQALMPGHAYLYGPDTRAGAGTMGVHGLRWAGIVYDWAAQAHGAGPLPAVIAIPPAQQAELSAELRSMVEIVRAGASNWRILSGGMLAAMLARLAAWSQSPAIEAERDLAVRAMRLLRERRARAWTIPAIARELGVGAPYLRKRMVERYGRPPLQLVNELRLDELRRLLGVERASPIEELCHRSGFADRRHAARLFLRRWGRTPKDFRSSLPPVS